MLEQHARACGVLQPQPLIPRVEGCLRQPELVYFMLLPHVTGVGHVR